MITKTGLLALSLMFSLHATANTEVKSELAQIAQDIVLSNEETTLNAAAVAVTEEVLAETEAEKEKKAKDDANALEAVEVESKSVNPLENNSK